MKILIRHNSYILTIAFAFLFCTCRKDSNPITSPNDRPILTSADYGKVVLTLSDYDTVRVTHQMGLDLRSPNVVRIGIGTKDSAGYRQSLSASTSFDPNAQAYIIHFDFSVGLDPMKAVAQLTVRYYFADSTYADADTTVMAYKYPYSTAEIVVPFSALQSLLGTHHLQDVDRMGLRVFFHLTGPGGLYVFDVGTQTITWLLQYNGGDHIAADSIFVFCDYGGEILRFNLTTNAVDLTIPRSAIQFDEIRGMDIYDGYLYIDRDFSKLKKYTLNGTVVDSSDYYTTYYMTIEDSIIYSVEQGPVPDQIKRYNMRTASFMARLLSPARSSEGIKVYQGKLYYCDFDKGIIGAVPISDLRTVQ